MKFLILASMVMITLSFPTVSYSHSPAMNRVHLSILESVRSMEPIVEPKQCLDKLEADLVTFMEQIHGTTVSDSQIRVESQEVIGHLVTFVFRLRYQGSTSDDYVEVISDWSNQCLTLGVLLHN
jgi:hypothetical protein